MVYVCPPPCTQPYPFITPSIHGVHVCIAIKYLTKYSIMYMQTKGGGGGYYISISRVKILTKT